MHVDRLADALRFEPCSPRCANWLRYGVPAKTSRPALPPRRVQGQGPPTRTPGLRRAPGPGLPQVVQARRWPTIAPTAKTGSWPPSVFRQPTQPTTPGNPSPPATRTTWNTPGGCCTSSPTGGDGEGTVRSRDAEQRSADQPGIFRQPGRRHDGARKESAPGTASHAVGGRRDPQYQRALPAPPDR